MKQPHEYKRRILLTVTGLSPQVVTETLYGLAHQEQPFIPTEVHLISTVAGAQQAINTLLAKDTDWFNHLINDYQLGPIKFTEDHIYVVPDKNGQPLTDIRSQEENSLAADFITNMMREFTLDDDTAVHVSIAGGRKTMGFFLGYALSLYGRTQDRLSHVLVSGEFESSRDFFYPTKESKVIVVREKQYLDCKDAVVTLADIPFVRMRVGMPNQLLEGSASYGESVAALNTNFGPSTLRIDRKKRLVEMAGIIFKLPPSDMAILNLFAERALHNEPPLSAPVDHGDYEWAERYLEHLEKVSGMIGDNDKSVEALANGMGTDYFSQRKSKLERNIKKHLKAHNIPERIIETYLISDGNVKPGRFHLPLKAEQIEFTDLDNSMNK